ncbi:MAG: UbiD family decarboxylase [Rhodospirillales bacterium]
MAADLRTFLAEHEASIYRPAAPLSVIQEITAIQHAVWEAGWSPMVVVDKPVLPNGKTAAMPVATNLFASRALCATALGLADHRDSARAFAALSAKPIPPVVFEGGTPPVQEVVQTGHDVDLAILPALHQHEGDAGRYVTAGHAITIDPDTGVDNMTIHRCQLRGPRLMGIYIYENSHSHLNVRRFWERGEACPVAIWVGHHPAAQMGAQAKQGYPQSHFASAGGALGEPLRVVPSITHGARIMVPADAELVIEGFIPPDRFEAEGPFAEYTGYQGPQVAQPVMEVTCITHRRDAIYHDIGSGLPDHLIPDNMAMEGTIYTMCRGAAPALVNVHVPFSGRRYHAYLQLHEPRTGEVRDALTTALGYRRLKFVVAVDTDIDMFDDRQVMWAISTRTQWHRDTIRIDGLSPGNLDPSLPLGWNTSTKLAIDATLPRARIAGGPKPVAPINRVSDDTLRHAHSLIAGADSRHWPKA